MSAALRRMIAGIVVFRRQSDMMACSQFMAQSRCASEIQVQSARHFAIALQREDVVIQLFA